MERYGSQCQACKHDKTFDTKPEANDAAVSHASKHPGHQVSIYREHLPDGGRDYLERMVIQRVKGKKKRK